MSFGQNLYTSLEIPTPLKSATRISYTFRHSELICQCFKCVSKYDYIIVHTKSQLGWLNLPHLPILPPPVTANAKSIFYLG